MYFWKIAKRKEIYKLRNKYKHKSNTKNQKKYIYLKKLRNKLFINIAYKNQKSLIFFNDKKGKKYMYKLDIRIHGYQR